MDNTATIEQVPVPQVTTPESFNDAEHPALGNVEGNSVPEMSNIPQKQEVLPKENQGKEITIVKPVEIAKKDGGGGFVLFTDGERTYKSSPDTPREILAEKIEGKSPEID